MDGTPETITIVYRAVVLNTSDNNRATPLNNAAVWRWDTSRTLAAAAADVNVVEPVMTIVKTASPTTGLDAGDTVTYTIVIANPNQANGAISP